MRHIEARFHRHLAIGLEHPAPRENQQGDDAMRHLNATTRGWRARIPALRARQHGRWGYILAWLLGVPIPILVLIYLLRGCT